MLVVLGLLIVLTSVLVGRWLNVNKVGGQQSAEPFRIAGNFYYVGASDVSAFLITGPEGQLTCCQLPVGGKDRWLSRQGPI